MVGNHHLFWGHQRVKTRPKYPKMESFQKIRKVSVHSKTGVDWVISFPGDGQNTPFWVVLGPLVLQNWTNMAQNGLIYEESPNKCTQQDWSRLSDELCWWCSETTKVTF